MQSILADDIFKIRFKRERVNTLNQVHSPSFILNVDEYCQTLQMEISRQHLYSLDKTESVLDNAN